MSPLATVGLTVFILVLFVGLMMSVYSLPGTVVILSDFFLYALVTGVEKVGFKVFTLLIVLAVIAEAIDIGLSAAGAARFGISRRMLWVSLFGGIAGALFLTQFLLGLGTFLGFFLGAFFVVVGYELSYQNHLRAPHRTGAIPFLKRIAAVSAKGFLSIVMIITALLSIYS